jgi:hypothetical protein
MEMAHWRRRIGGLFSDDTRLVVLRDRAVVVEFDVVRFGEVHHDHPPFCRNNAYTRLPVTLELRPDRVKDIHRQMLLFAGYVA